MKIATGDDAELWQDAAAAKTVLRLVDDLVRPFPGLFLGLEDLGLDVREQRAGLPGASWFPREDELLVTHRPSDDSTERISDLSFSLAHELWHRRSVQSRFWATPNGSRWFHRMRSEAAAYFDTCQDDVRGGQHSKGYLQDCRPEHGMTTPLHRAAEELLADRCGAAAEQWVYGAFFVDIEPRRLRGARAGLPALTWRRP